MAKLEPFQGDDWFDLTGYGETLYFSIARRVAREGRQPVR
jgi:hypothetical protein